MTQKDPFPHRQKREMRDATETHQETLIKVFLMVIGDKAISSVGTEGEKG